jgi:death-on-curing protein
VTIHLTLEHVLGIAEKVLGAEPKVRDLGLLESAVHRPTAEMFGRELYPDLHLKAAALLQSIGTNHALFDGNKRLAWAAMDVFLAVNGREVVTDEDSAYDFVIAVVTSELSDVSAIADVLRSWT